LKGSEISPERRRLLSVDEQSQGSIGRSIGMEYGKFTSLVLTKMCNSERKLGNHNLTNYTAISREFPTAILDLLSALCVRASIGYNILIQTVEN
jgi:hypothetical protein